MTDIDGCFVTSCIQRALVFPRKLHLVLLKRTKERKIKDPGLRQGEEGRGGGGRIFMGH